MLRLIGRALYRVYFRGRADSLVPIPRSGPVILVANHTSLLDGILIHIVSRRPLRIFIAEEWADWWPMQPLFRTMGLIRVDRDRRNAEALEAAVAALQREDAVALFPEAGIQASGELGPFRHGAARLALRTGAPVFPCAIIGSFEAMPWPKRVPRPRRITVRCGHPIRFSPLQGGKLPAEALSSVTEQIRKAVQEMIALGHR